MIAIIDYGSGNVHAIANIYKQLGITHTIVRDHSELKNASRYILPGVGHFDYTMREVRGSGLLDVLQEQVVIRQKPLIGICVGMQLLADASEEGDEVGFSWISGRVKSIDAREHGVRLPHMGWNAVRVEHDDAGLFRGIDVDTGFYFLHNYHFVADEPQSVMATTMYGSSLVCAVTNGRNVFGTQFHPEKSHSNGLRLFKNFAYL